MHFKERRRFLLGSGYVAGTSLLGGLAGCQPGTMLPSAELPEPEVVERSIAPPPPAPVPTADDLTRISIVDTIIPEDEAAGAISVGLDILLQTEMSGRPQINDLVKRLVHSVTQMSLARHRAQFRDLSLDLREEFLTELLNNKTNAIVWRDMWQMRRLIVTWFYQSDAGAKSVGFWLPPTYPSYPG